MSAWFLIAILFGLLITSGLGYLGALDGGDAEGLFLLYVILFFGMAFFLSFPAGHIVDTAHERGVLEEPTRYECGGQDMCTSWWALFVYIVLYNLVWISGYYGGKSLGRLREGGLRETEWS